MAKHSAFLDLAKGVTDSSFVLTPDKKIVDFNRVFVKLHKVGPRSLKAIKGSICQDFVDMEICEKNCILLKCLEVNAPVRFDEVKGKAKDGSKLNLIVTAIPVRNEKGKIVSVLEMHRDVTDEAKIHDKYKVLLDKEKRAKEELERLVEERTKELRKTNEDLKRTESQLVQSEKMSSLGQMVAGIAHELNNPINFISGNVDIVEEYIEDIKKAIHASIELIKSNDKLREQIESLNDELEIDYKVDDLGKIASSIRTGSERAAEIIQGLRTFSRLDEAQLKETDIQQDIDLTLMLLRNQYKDRIQIHKEYGDVPPFRCFSSQLNQVYMNLLQNAIHAIEGKGDIWIRTRHDGSHLFIEIQDSGKGISEKVRAKIFDPFFTTKPVGKGTGLGLAVTYGIVDRHGGQIEVESKEGKGTLFRVKIPEKKQEAFKEEK